MDTNNCSDGENNIGENVSVFSTWPSVYKPHGAISVAVIMSCWMCKQLYMLAWYSCT